MTQRPVGAAQRALFRSLRIVVGGEARVAALMAALVAEAGIESTPEQREELLLFVRDRLVPRVSETYGHSAAATFIEDLLDEISHEEAKGTLSRDTGQFRLSLPSRPLRRRTMGIVEDDPLQRASITRSLIRESIDVVPYDEPAKIEVLALSMRGKHVRDALGKLSAEVPVIAYAAADVESALHLLREAGVTRARVLGSGVPWRKLALAAHALLGD